MDSARRCGDHSWVVAGGIPWPLRRIQGEIKANEVGAREGDGQTQGDQQGSGRKFDRLLMSSFLPRPALEAGPPKKPPSRIRQQVLPYAASLRQRRES